MPKKSQTSSPLRRRSRRLGRELPDTEAETDPPSGSQESNSSTLSENFADTNASLPALQTPEIFGSTEIIGSSKIVGESGLGEDVENLQTSLRAAAEMASDLAKGTDAPELSAADNQADVRAVAEPTSDDRKEPGDAASAPEAASTESVFGDTASKEPGDVTSAASSDSVVSEETADKTVISDESNAASWTAPETPEVTAVPEAEVEVITLDAESADLQQQGNEIVAELRSDEEENGAVFKIPEAPPPENSAIPGIMETDSPVVNNSVELDQEAPSDEQLFIEKALNKIEPTLELALAYLESAGARATQLNKNGSKNFRNMTTRLKQLSDVAGFLLNVAKARRLPSPVKPKPVKVTTTQHERAFTPRAAPARQGLLGDRPIRKALLVNPPQQRSLELERAPSVELLEVVPILESRPLPWSIPPSSELRRDWDVTESVFAWQGLWHPFSLNHPFECRIGDLTFVSMLHAFYFIKAKIMLNDELAVQVKATNLFLVPDLRDAVPETDQTGLWGRKVRTKLLKRLMMVKYEQCARFKACVDTVAQLRLICYENDDELCAGLTLDQLRAEGNLSVGQIKGKNIYGQLLTDFVKNMQASRTTPEDELLSVGKYCDLESYDEVMLASKKIVLLNSEKFHLKGIFRTYSLPAQDSLNSGELFRFPSSKQFRNPSDYGCIVLFPGFANRPGNTAAKAEDFVAFFKSIRRVSLDWSIFVLASQSDLASGSLSAAAQLLGDRKLFLVDSVLEIPNVSGDSFSDRIVTVAEANRILEILSERLPFLNVDYVFNTEIEVLRFVGSERVARKPDLEESEMIGDGGQQVKRARKRKSARNTASQSDVEVRSEPSPKRQNPQYESFHPEVSPVFEPVDHPSKAMTETKTFDEGIEAAKRVQQKLSDFLASKLKAREEPVTGHFPKPLVAEVQPVSSPYSAPRPPQARLPPGIAKIESSGSSIPQLPTVGQIKAMSDIVATGNPSAHTGDGSHITVQKAKETLVRMLKAYNVDPEEVVAKQAKASAPSQPTTSHPQYPLPRPVAGSNLVQDALRSSYANTMATPVSSSLSQKELTILEAAAMTLARGQIRHALPEYSRSPNIPAVPAPTLVSGDFMAPPMAPRNPMAPAPIQISGNFAAPSPGTSKSTHTLGYATTTPVSQPSSIPLTIPPPSLVPVTTIGTWAGTSFLTTPPPSAQYEPAKPIDVAERTARILAAAKSKIAEKAAPRPVSPPLSASDSFQSVKRLIDQHFAAAETEQVQSCFSDPDVNATALTPARSCVSPESDKWDKLYEDFLASKSEKQSDIRPGSPPPEPVEDERVRAIKELERKLADLKGEMEKGQNDRQAPGSKDPTKSLLDSIYAKLAGGTAISAANEPRVSSGLDSGHPSSRPSFAPDLPPQQPNYAKLWSNFAPNAIAPDDVAYLGENLSQNGATEKVFEGLQTTSKRPREVADPCLEFDYMEY